MQAIQTLGYLDTGFIIVLSISVIIGLIRGAVREITSLVGLMLAIYLAFKFSGVLNEKYTSQFLTGYSGLSYAVTFILILMVCILAFALINLIISQLLKFSGLSIFDRFLGMIFGVLRGTLIVCIFVFVARLFPIVSKSDMWKKSSLIPVFNQITDVSIKYLPKELTGYFNKDSIDKLKQNVIPNDSGVEQSLNSNYNQNASPANIDELNKKIEEISRASDNENVKEMVKSISNEMNKQRIKLESLEDDSNGTTNQQSPSSTNNKEIQNNILQQIKR